MNNNIWTVSVPDGKSPCNGVIIESFSISKEDAIVANRFATSYTRVSEGDFKRLLVNGEVMMSNTRMEVSTNTEFVEMAHGSILINGLGLGMVVEKLLENDKVKHVTIIEFDQRVIDLVSPQFESNSRVTIIHDDAFTHKPKRGSYYDYVWHDIWQDLCGDNLKEMKILHKKYSRRSGWQGSWAKHICKLLKKGYRI
jgi:spermidine synthase